MTTISISAEARSRAEPAIVFALLKDGDTWPAWAMFDAFVLERPGVDEPMGVGAIRVFITKATRAREEVVELIPNRRLSYILLSGFPFTDYRADVDLTAVDGGTVIRWSASFAPNQPWLGWFWKRFMIWVMSSTAARLAAGAEDPTVVAKLKPPIGEIRSHSREVHP
jgi:uncharacterized protein YndB with AHSA1/START domain